MREYVTGGKVADPFGGVGLAELPFDAPECVFVPVSCDDPKSVELCEDSLYRLVSLDGRVCGNVFKMKNIEASVERSRHFRKCRYGWVKAMAEGEPGADSGFVSCVFDVKEFRVVYVVHPDDPEDWVVTGNILISKDNGVVVYLPSMETVYASGNGDGFEVVEYCDKYAFLKDSGSECGVFIRVNTETGVVKNLLEE